MKRFEAIADRIGEHDQVLHAALVGKRRSAARDFHVGGFEPRGERIERASVRDFPTMERRIAGASADDHALLAVVHAQRKALAALVDELHPEEARCISRPILEPVRANSHIAECLERHDDISCMSARISGASARV